MTQFARLFEPLHVGSMTLRNRVVAAPITKYGLLPSPADELETIAAKARGGAALIVLGSVGVNDTDSLIYHQASSLDGPKKPWFNEVVSIAHQYGAKIEAQLLHCGMWADVRGTGARVVGSTDETLHPGRFRGLEGIEGEQVMDGRRVHALDEAGMDAVCADYARSARAARRMGFDMVMLHFAHGWLPAQFLSPYFNRRSDRFGGSFENRARFPQMIIERVRDAVGPDFPIDMRIGAHEYVQGGLQVDDVVRFVQLVEDRIDLVHVSSGLDKLLGPTSYIESPSVLPHLINVEFSRAVRSAVQIPVVTVGGITLPDEAEQVLARGDADAIALGRALIADPDWVDKARTGPQERIRPCLRCDSCYTVATDGYSQGCAVNPEYTRSLRLAVEHSRPVRPKSVVVVGGGPAGMTAATVAARRGHQVTLLERSERLGGLLNVADGDEIKRDLWAFRQHLVAEVEDAGVDVRLRTEATAELVHDLVPDDLVVAVGSVPFVPPVPGAGLEHVLDVLQAHERWDELADRVAVIGAGPSGCEIAVSLARSGRRVVLVEQATALLADANLLYRGAVQELFAAEDRIELLLGTRCVRITADGVDLDGPRGPSRVAAGSVIICVGTVPRRESAADLARIRYDPKVIGDCVSARRVNEAVHEGYFAGLRL